MKINRVVSAAVGTTFFIGSSLLSTPVAGATFSSTGQFCTIVGTEFDDFLVGTTSDDVICGLGGDDVIEGGGGDDQIFGGSGEDEIYGELGDDYLEGGPGADRLFGGDGRDALIAGDGDDQLIGGQGSDSLSGGDGVDYCEKDKRDSSVESCFYDASKPKLVSIAISGKTIDTSQAAAVLVLRARLIDKGTGVGLIGLSFVPKGLSGSNWSMNFGIGAAECKDNQPSDPTVDRMFTACRVSGDEFNGVYEIRALIPRLTPKSTFTLGGFTVTDVGGNSTYMDAGDLKAKKLAVSFKQVGAGDSSKPKISAFQLITKSINTNTKPGIVSLRVRAKDSGSGLASVGGYFIPKLKNRTLDLGDLSWNVDFSNISALACQNGVASDPGPGEKSSACLVKGDQFDALISVKIRVPQYSPKVDYWMDGISAKDNVQNNVEYIDTKPWNKIRFSQKGSGDSKTPKITEISVITPNVDSASVAQETAIRVRFSDNMSGIQKIEIGFAKDYSSAFMFFAFDPANQKCNSNRTSALPGGSCLITGSLKNGLVEMRSTLPAHTPRGSYFLQQALITDRANNGAGCGRDSCHESNIITNFSVTNIQITNGN
jgi:hypothetical protein